MKIAGFSYIYNGVDHDIPFVESIESVIDVVDQFVLTECYSTDRTWELCQDLQKKYPTKIFLIRRPWVKHYSEISSLANWTSLHIDKDIDYVFQLQSDEVIHEDDLEKLRVLPEILENEGKTAASWGYHHFLGGPSITFPFCYQRLVRFVKKKSLWVVVGDGVEFSIPSFFNDDLNRDIYTSSINVFHYGKMKSPQKGFKKEVSFQNLYTDIGFPDPKMKEMKNTLDKEYCDYVYLFKDHIVNNTITKFSGTHPKVMSERIKEFYSQGYEQMLSLVDRDLKIKT